MLTQKHKTDKAVWPTEGKLQTTPFLFRSRKRTKSQINTDGTKHTTQLPQRTSLSSANSQQVSEAKHGYPWQHSRQFEGWLIRCMPGVLQRREQQQKNASTTAVPTARLSVKAKLTLQASLSGTLPPLEEGRGKPVAGVWSKLRHSNHHEWLRLG